MLRKVAVTAAMASVLLIARSAAWRYSAKAERLGLAFFTAARRRAAGGAHLHPADG